MIYIASKVKHAERWRKLRELGVPFNSTWIDEAGQGETECFSDLWDRCINEASGAHCLIAYLEPEEVPKGLLVEIGAALSFAVPVYLVGFQDVKWTFKNHPLAMCVSSLGTALELAGYVGGIHASGT